MIVRFAGFGGQGVVLCGYVFGKAAMLDGKNSMHTQSYGSASRGGLTRSDVGISDGEIYDLHSDEVDVLVAMSQQSFDAFRPILVPEGLLVYESDLVKVSGDDINTAHGLQATEIAYKRFGRKIIANMVMMGFVNQVAGLVTTDALRRTITESVPRGTEDINITALEEGMKLGLQS